MKYIYPDFYPDFACLAGDCRHSCCIGWEIGIDAESMEYYSQLGGTTGEKLRKNISSDPEPHFILGKDERCPFLNEDNLCDLILTLGEDSLSEICTEHPRFYNDFPSRVEYGLGMCCEAAAALLLSGTEPLGFACEDDGENNEEEDAVFALRDELFEILATPGRPFVEKMREAARRTGHTLPELKISDIAELLLGLERLDERWTEILHALRGFDDARLPEALNAVRYERIAEYFLFRYFASAEEEQRGAVTAFACLAAKTVCALDLAFGESAEHLRMFSAEIEYSDENVGIILETLQ